MFKPVHALRGYLTAELSAGATAIALDDASVAILHSILDGTDHTYLSVQKKGSYETIKLVSFTGDVINIARAQDGTIAQDFAANAPVSFALCLSAISDIADEVVLNGVDITGEGVVKVTKNSPTSFSIHADSVELVSGSDTLVVSGSFPNYTLDVPAPTDCCDPVNTNNAPPNPIHIIGTPPQGTVGVPYTFTWTAIGGSGIGYVWAIDSGTIPTGLSFNTATGTLSGTPTTAALYTFVLRVTDNVLNTATANESILIVTVYPAVGYVSIANTHVAVLDPSFAVIATPAITNPDNIAVLPDRSHAYVACDSGNVAVIEAIGYTVSNTIPLGTVNNCTGIAIKRDGTKVYVAVGADGVVKRIDVLTQTVDATYSGFLSPSIIIMHPTLDRMYVVDQNAGTVVCMDTSGTILGHYTTTYPPVGVGISFDGAWLYVGCYGDVEAFDTTTFASHAWQCNLRSGFGPNNVAVKLDGSKIYVSDYNYISVSVVDTTTHLLIGYINVGTLSNDIKTNPISGKIFVPAGTLQVIDPATDTVINSIPVGTSPKWLAFPP